MTPCWGCPSSSGAYITVLSKQKPCGFSEVTTSLRSSTWKKTKKRGKHLSFCNKIIRVFQAQTKDEVSELVWKERTRARERMFSMHPAQAVPPAELTCGHASGKDAGLALQWFLPWASSWQHPQQQPTTAEAELHGNSFIPQPRWCSKEQARCQPL